MYHCHLHFYLTGHRCKIFEIVKDMPPLAHFTHVFSEGGTFEGALNAKADVIFLNLQEMDAAEATRILKTGKGEKSRIILLADKAQFPQLSGCLERIGDIWTLPMTEEEVRFRFLRWQQRCRQELEQWQTSQYLEATINSIPNLIWYKDKEGIHRKVNDSFCKTVNKTKRQVEGRDHYYIWDVTPEEAGTDCMESDLEVMRIKETCVSEESVKTGDGLKLMTTYKSPLYDWDGSVMGTVGVGIDVTQERAYEQELIQKSHMLEKIFNTIDCGIICHSMDGKRIIQVNEMALRILGYRSREELIDSGFDMIASSVMDEDKPRLRECIRMLKKEGDCVNIEYRVEHDSGEILYVMGNFKVLEKNGELYCQRFLLDCTAQKLEKEKDKKYQAQLVQALSSDYGLVCYFNLDTGMGITIRANDIDNRIFQNDYRIQISFQERMERYIEKVVYEEDREMMRQTCSLEAMKKALREKRLYHINYRVLQDGEMRYYEMKAVRGADEQGEGSGVVLGFRNVDEETRREMERRKLLEDALMQANQANNAKSVFLSNMSHDIRTPMNAIFGFTNLAIAHIDNKERVEDYLKKIMVSGNHLLGLINEVLDMSRIESGKMQIEESLCSLSDIVHGLGNIVQTDIQAKNLTLYMNTVDVIDEEIYCDKLRLNQVLLNILGNSIKYTKEGGEIGLWITEKAGALAGYANYEFRIRDTGIGMSREFIPHIFEPFEREKNTTTSGIQGTGLGMAITRSIIDMMNGSIEVESEEGAGTEVTVSVTFRINPAAENAEIPELVNRRVLVVNVDLNTQNNMSHLLQTIGMRADWASSEQEAVRRIREMSMRGESYGSYLIDWRLPDMDVAGTVARIRSEAGENPTMVVLTSYDWSEIEEAAKAAGVTSFCSKPLFLSELKSCLQTAKDGEEVREDNRGEGVKSDIGHILLVEDNELNQEIAVAILEDAGFRPEIASNGQIAVDMVRASKPGYYGLVLMDVQMPVMNGYEATREIRRLEDCRLASIPILAMTANAFEKDKQEALKCGMNGHIAKPIDIEKMLDILHKVLAKGGGEMNPDIEEINGSFCIE